MTHSLSPQLSALLADPSSATPMMQQYLLTKKEHQDALLFYRMGDFYELFFDDAVIAAKDLDIALTHRGKTDDQSQIPMCGVPHHSYEPYLQKLIRAGHKVAICEQMESPEEAKKRGPKAVVRRDVIRIVTPGTLVEDALLEGRESNFLAAIVQQNQHYAMAWVDISTGQLMVSELAKPAIASQLARIYPKELLLPDVIAEDGELNEILLDYRSRTTQQVASYFAYAKCERKCKDFYGVAFTDGFGDLTKAEITACGALLEYVSFTQCGKEIRILMPKRQSTDHAMHIDAAAWRSLEIAHSLGGSRKGSVLAAIDYTLTGAGARMLASHLSAPLLDAKRIAYRQDMVACLVEQPVLRAELRGILTGLPDVERALTRIAIGKAGPRDLVMVREGIAAALRVTETLQGELASGIKQCLERFKGFESLLTSLQRFLVDEPGMLARDGGFIKEKADEELDKYRQLRDHGKENIAALRDKYREETGVQGLKVTQNNVLGYFVEVTPQHGNKLTDPPFIHRQTLAGCVRFTTQELRDLEQAMISAKDQALQIEQALFIELVESILQQSEAIAAMAHHLAILDMVAGLAELAVEKNYTRPLVDDSLQFIVSGGRHPVVEKALPSGENFVKNDCNLSDSQRLWLLTGPNMAGKSTFLRQNALIAILAQIGAYVPADAAHIGVVDRVFSRVGASDDLAHGRSTFMVEMIETAQILNQATERSLVILDEIGRGTATFDGLSIAWAVVEYLHEENKSRGLFATHYHELTNLVERLKNLACYSMKVQEWQGEVMFMHEVIAGAADRSYGIHVGKLAGLPAQVVERATEVLESLQASKTANIGMKTVSELPLFAAETPKPSANDNILGQIKEKNIDELSPKQALDFLYALKEQL